MRIAFALCLLAVAFSAPAHAESGQKVRPLDPNDPADQKEIIRWLDPSGTASPDELMRTFIDVNSRFTATNRDIKAAGLWQADYTAPNNVHFTVIADYGVKFGRQGDILAQALARRDIEKIRASDMRAGSGRQLHRRSIAIDTK